MAHFLLIYDRGAGKLLGQQVYTTGAEALNARFRAEAAHGIDDNVEMVTLSAGSEAELHRTHGRSFLNCEQLGQRLTAA